MVEQSAQQLADKAEQAVVEVAVKRSTARSLNSTNRWMRCSSRPMNGCRPLNHQRINLLLRRNMSSPQMNQPRRSAVRLWKRLTSRLAFARSWAHSSAGRH